MIDLLSMRAHTADGETDVPDELEAHLQSRTPDWASEVSGVPVEAIIEFGIAGAVGLAIAGLLAGGRLIHF